MAINTLFQNIADAIRERGGTSAALTPAQMPQAIADIPAGGGEAYNLIYYGSVNTSSANSTITYTFAEGGNFSLILHLVNNSTANLLTDVNISINGNRLDNYSSQSFVGTGGKALCYTKIDIAVNAGDVLIVKNVSAFASCGLQLFIIDNIATLTYSVIGANGNGTSDSTIAFINITIPAIYLYVSGFGYYYSYQNTQPAVELLKLYGSNTNTFPLWLVGNNSNYYGGGCILGKLEEVNNG